MDLKTFVATSLTQILDGIRAPKKHLAGSMSLRRAISPAKETC